MRAHPFRLILAAAIALSPVATLSAPLSAGFGFPDLRYNTAPPDRLAVGGIDIVDRDPPAAGPPRVDQFFPVPPRHAMENWAHDRLAAVGGPYRLRFTIERARVDEIPIPPDPAYTDPQTRRYEGIIAARLDILAPNGTSLATVIAHAARSQGVLASTAPAQRAQIWYDMTAQMMAMLNSELERQIHAELASYLR
jgi:hypothetical protein